MNIEMLGHVVNKSSDEDQHNQHAILPIFTRSQTQIFAIVNYIVLCGFISVFGIITNLINMVVFHKQGLNTSTNICFFSLAVSDLCVLIIQQTFNFYINPLTRELNMPIIYTEVQYLTSSVPREVFARITCFITVYMTAERCLCVVFPLHIKQMITTRKTRVILILLYSVEIMCALPLYVTHYLGWKCQVNSNISLLGIIVTNSNDEGNAIVYAIHAFSGLISILVVVALALVLINKLREKNAWRKTANAQRNNSESVSRRDRATIAVVVVVASVLIVCYTPSTVLAVATVLEPEFGIGGKYYSLYSFFWSFAFIFENINSSINIFLYLKMSSRYREKFNEIFCTRQNERKTIFNSVGVRVSSVL